jgi:UDP-glucose 4-epimerase
MTRRALVTGAHGFIGRHVCQSLAARGDKVHALGHGSWTQAEAAQWGVSRWLEADITVGSLAEVMDSCVADAVIHCAGSGSVSAAYQAPFDDYQRSVTTVAALLEFVRRSSNGARVVITSSAAVYGDQGDVDLAESSVCSPISPYGFNKRAAEDLCKSYSRFFGLEITIVRLFSVYGEGLRKQLLWDAANKLGRGDCRFFGTGHELRDWIHVADAASLLCAAALQSHAKLEIFNGANAKATTSQVLAMLENMLQSAVPPSFTGETHFGNPRRLTADDSHVRGQLDWVPTIGLEEGLRRYATWFKRDGAGSA